MPKMWLSFDLRFRCRSHVHQFVANFTPILKDANSSAVPRIVWSPKNVTAVIGANITFLCRIESQTEPPTELSWLKNGRPLDATQLAQASGMTVRLSDNETVSSLSLNAIDPTDDGLYECRAHNSLGQDISSAAALTVLSKPLITCYSHRWHQNHRIYINEWPMTALKAYRLPEDSWHELWLEWWPLVWAKLRPSEWLIGHNGDTSLNRIN